MRIEDYFTQLNESCQKIFQDTLREPERFGTIHHFSTCLIEFAEGITEKKERELLKVVSSQLEVSAFSVSLGLYRQGFSSLRLAFEMGLGLIYLSAFKLEQYEWLNGQADIKWARIIDKENGVLSKRFIHAFFPNLEEDFTKYHSDAESVYRKLSEFVHGNYETWVASSLVIQKNDELLTKYFEYFDIVKSILLFCLCCRYLQLFPERKIESMTFLAEEMGHIDSIRIFIGGPGRV